MSKNDKIIYEVIYMKKFKCLSLLFIATASLFSTSCSSKNNKTSILKSDLASGKICSILATNDFYRLVDGKASAVIAITNSSQESTLLINTLKDYVSETEAIIHEVSYAVYSSLDTILKMPKLSDVDCPAILILNNGKVKDIVNFHNDKSVFTSSSKIKNYLNSKIIVRNIYNFASIQNISSSDYEYYFYTNTDARLTKYLLTDQSEINYPFVVAFYDSTQEKDFDFIMNVLPSIANKNIKTYVIDVTFDKYNYDIPAHTLELRKDEFYNYAMRFTFGNFADSKDKIVTTPAINYYNEKKNESCIIYGTENYTDPLNTYEVVKTTSQIKKHLSTLA